MAVLTVLAFVGVLVGCGGGNGPSGLTDSVAKRPPKPPPDPPDGNPAICYVKASWMKPAHLYVMDADGANKQLVFSDRKKDVACPRWSPDGQRIAFILLEKTNMSTTILNIAICTIRPDGSDFQLVWDFPGHPMPQHIAWTPDGTKIVFTQRVEGPDLYYLHVDGPPEPVALADYVVGSAGHDGFDISPDLDAGTPGYQGGIAYHGWLEPENNPVQSGMILVEVEIAEPGGDIEVLRGYSMAPHASGQHQRASWSPDGRFFSVYTGDGPAICGVGLVDGFYGFTSTTQVYAWAYPHRWSPGMEYVVYQLAGESRGDVMRANFTDNGDGSVAVTDQVALADDSKKQESAADWNPAWTP